MASHTYKHRPERTGAGKMGVAYAGTSSIPFTASRNSRRDVYDREVTARQAFRNQYEWLASYTRSRALSNAVVDISADDPLLVTSNIGRMPWDTPNRFLSWGYLPTWWENWAVAYLLEARNGFRSRLRSSGRVTGAPNQMRFPHSSGTQPTPGTPVHFPRTAGRSVSASTTSRTTKTRTW